MRLLIYTFLLTIWFGCGVIGAGESIAFFSRRYLRLSKIEYIFHLLSIIGGPIILIISFSHLHRFSYGWTLRPWKAIKIQAVENALDGVTCVHTYRISSGSYHDY